MEYLNNIIFGLVTFSALWVYADASQNKIGNTPHKSLLNVGGAGWWGSLCLLLWIVAFPLYLLNRKKLINLAKEYPVESKHRNFKILVFFAIFITSLWFSFISTSPKLPNCSDQSTINTLKSAISSTPAYKILNIQNIEINNVSERPSSTKDKKICRASLEIPNIGSQVIYYSIDWQNKDKGEIWVQTIDGE